MVFVTMPAFMALWFRKWRFVQIGPTWGRVHFNKPPKRAQKNNKG